jgi:NAD(P)-dependent dehydrogenase (short-subunit alcohol dehydrogenase family)
MAQVRSAVGANYLTQNVPVMALFDLTGRVAVVTGGAGLYGTQISTALAEAGATVVIAARDQSRAGALAANLCARGLRARALPLDLADEDSIVALRNRVIGDLGGIAILVNNAVHRQGGTIEATTRADWEATARVNATGLFLMCKHVGAQMVAQGQGVIINIGSIHGVIGPDFAVYEGADFVSPAFYAYDKGGMLNFTRYLANYYAPHGIRVNCLSPGGFLSGQDGALVHNYCQRTPMGRMAGPNDLKGAVVFLASDASAYVTGSNLLVDGGWTAH